MDLDTLLQRILVATGIVFFFIAILLMISPSTAAILPFGAGTVGGIGVITMLLGLVSIRSRLRGTLEETETPDPELPPRNPTPGDEIDRMLYEMTVLRQGTLENREELENRLELLAVEIIRDRHDCSEPDAVRMLESGEWTDSEVAAAFFQESSTDDTSSAESSIQNLFFDSDGREQEFEVAFRRTVDALAEVANVETSSFEGNGGSGSFLGDGGDGDVSGNWNVEDSSVPSFETEGPFKDVSVHRTNRWIGVTAFGLLAVGLGIFTQGQGLMLAGTIGVIYTVYARVYDIPPLEDLAVEREFSDENPRPGDEIQVTVTMRNTGDTILPNLRVVDVPPDAFVVTNGSPRLHTALRPGAEASFSYTVRVERGMHTWPLLTIGRGFSGGVERDSLITPDAELTCVPLLGLQSDIPVRAQTTQYSGEVTTTEGGSGLELHSVREYQQGDPMNRIDWNRVAMGEDFATIDFRQEQAATVTLLFDTRQNAYSSQGPGKPHAVDLSVHVASDIFAALYDAGNLVGIAAYDTVPCWLGAGAGSEHFERARLLFAQHPALSPQPPDRQEIQGSYINPMTHVRRRLSNNSQIFMFSPLTDEYAAEVARRLDSTGHLVTIISPDTTADRSIGQRMVGLERTVRVRSLREHAIRVVDWNPDERLDLTLNRTEARWAR